jgi:hypothetical protein
MLRKFSTAVGALDPRAGLHSGRIRAASLVNAQVPRLGPFPSEGTGYEEARGMAVAADGERLHHR